MTKLVIAVAVCILSAAVYAAPATLSSPAGDRTITTFDSGLIVYQSANGRLEIHVTKTGLQIGDDLFLGADQLSTTSSTLKLHLSVKHGKHDKIEDDVEVNLAANEARGQRLGEINAELHRFAQTDSGHLLQEARDLIVAYSASSTFKTITGTASASLTHGFSFSIASDGTGWGCTADVLNAVAAGAAMVGGCGTPSCGTAYRWCCGGGIAWYASSLIQIANNGNCLL
jgi:hypothetical protein